MPVHIEEMTSEVTVMTGDLPLTEPQIEALVKMVIKRLAEKERDVKRAREDTKLKRQSSTPFEPGA